MHGTKYFIVGVMSILFLPFGASAAPASNSGFIDSTAQAFFSSVQGCDDVVVGVSATDPEKRRGDSPIDPSQAFIFASFNNICDIGSSSSFAGVVILDEDDFVQKGVNNATLNVTTNIGGHDVVIALNWEGIGEADRNKNMVHIKQDGLMIHDSDVISNRTADITGTFTIDGINYAVGTQTGGLSTVKDRTVQKTF